MSISAVDQALCRMEIVSDSVIAVEPGAAGDVG
jgi:hypothetical protein